MRLVVSKYYLDNCFPFVSVRLGHGFASGVVPGGRSWFQGIPLRRTLVRWLPVELSAHAQPFGENQIFLTFLARL